MEDEISKIFGINDKVKTKAACCDTHGEYESRRQLFNRWTGCPQCETVEIAKREAETKAVEERKRKARVDQLTEASKLPLRFLDRTLKSYIADTPEKKRALAFAEQYADTFKAIYQTGQCAMFIGRPGTGKTHLAAGIGLQLLNRGYPVLYTTVSRLIRRIRSTWNRASEETEAQAIKAFTTPCLLILDEVGVQYGSEAEKNTLFDVLNERYENRMPTLLISNLNKAEVANALGDCVFDRIREDEGRVIAFNWESERPKTAMKVAVDGADTEVQAQQQMAEHGAVLEGSDHGSP